MSFKKPNETSLLPPKAPGIVALAICGLVSAVGESGIPGIDEPPSDWAKRTNSVSVGIFVMPGELTACTGTAGGVANSDRDSRRNEKPAVSESPPSEADSFIPGTEPRPP